MKDYDKSKPALILAPHWAQSKTPDSKAERNPAHTDSETQSSNESNEASSNEAGQEKLAPCASIYLTTILSAVEQH